jgi:hypothetical protein
MFILNLVSACLLLLADIVAEPEKLMLYTSYGSVFKRQLNWVISRIATIIRQQSAIIGGGIESSVRRHKYVCASVQQPPRVLHRSFPIKCRAALCSSIIFRSSSSQPHHQLAI